MTPTLSLRFSQQIYITCIRFITKPGGTPSTLRMPPPPHNQGVGLQSRRPPPPSTAKTYGTITVAASKTLD